jgi:Proline utilization A proline dehydrogenase N-terminal domain
MRFSRYDCIVHADLLPRQCLRRLSLTFAANRFSAFRSDFVAQRPLRAAITAAYRCPEPDCVPPLLELVALAPDQAERIESLARSLMTKLRAKTRSAAERGDFQAARHMCAVSK